MAAADNLAGRQGLAAFAAAPAAGAGAGTGIPLIQAAGIRHSGNDWQARNDLRNAEVSAGSIMNRAEWSRSGKPDAEGKIAAFNAAKAADAALRGQQPAADTAAMQANAGLQGEGMRQQGANTTPRVDLSAAGRATACCVTWTETSTPTSPGRSSRDWLACPEIVGAGAL